MATRWLIDNTVLEPFLTTLASSRRGKDRRRSQVSGVDRARCRSRGDDGIRWRAAPVPYSQTTTLYDRTGDAITLDEVERIRIRDEFRVPRTITGRAIAQRALHNGQRGTRR